MKKQKIAVMGGTFDPIHLGHLLMAEIVRSDAGMDRVLFIPAGNPPHKRDNEITSPEDRFQMTNLAIQDHPYFDVSRMEIDRPGYTYTVETMKLLEEQNDGSKEYYILLGADAFAYVPHWREAEKVISQARFIVVQRPGYMVESPENLPEIDFRTIFVPMMDISSTMIRERIKEQLSIRYMVPEAVRDYIETHGLYR